MTVKVVRDGDFLVIRVDSETARSLPFGEGDTVELSAVEGSLVVAKGTAEPDLRRVMDGIHEQFGRALKRLAE